MGRSVLVTGIDGFTGRYAKHALELHGYRVLGLSNNSSPNWIECDLRDYDAVASVISNLKPDYVLHLAGISSPAHADVEEFYSCNVIATTNLLEALSVSKHEVRKVVLASSSNVYGDSDEMLTEEMPFRPKGHYAASKVAMELMANNFMDLFPIVVARPFNYTGPKQRNDFVVPKIVYHFAQKAEHIKLGNINVQRDFMDVRDVVSAYIAILESDLQSEAVNICSGKAFSIERILEVLSEMTSHSLVREIADDLIRQNEVSSIVGAPTRLYEETGFTPRYDIRTTLSDMLEAAR